jgi:hypothetical protein
MSSRCLACPVIVWARASRCKIGFLFQIPRKKLAICARVMSLGGGGEPPALPVPAPGGLRGLRNIFSTLPCNGGGVGMTRGGAPTGNTPTNAIRLSPSATIR